MRRIKAKTKKEKCKAGRCMGKRVENARYCILHMQDNTITIAEARKQYLQKLEIGGWDAIIHKEQAEPVRDAKPSLLQRIKNYIFVQK